MYVPSHFAADQDAVRDLLSNPGAANLVTSTEHGLLATLVPFVFDPEAGEHGSLQGHLARNNDQWRLPASGESLVIIQRSDAYISPSWYAAKAEHGRVVPTWNYTTAHVYGRLVIHDDPAWVEGLVRRLTTLHEAAVGTPLDRGRCARAFHRRAAPGDCRRRTCHHEGGSETQAQPEPVGCRH